MKFENLSVLAHYFRDCKSFALLIYRQPVLAYSFRDSKSFASLI